MTTTTITGIDESAMNDAAKIFGTGSPVATINAALNDAIKRRKRSEFFAFLESGGLPDLTGPIEYDPPKSQSVPA